MRQKRRRANRPAHRASLGHDRRGIGGFFEEIPAFVVVVLSVSLFLVAAHTTYGRLGQDRELSSLRDDCQRLCRAFRGYEAVLEKGPSSLEPRSGVFDQAKLDGLEPSGLRRDINSPHPYNLSVRDLVLDRGWSFGMAPPPDAALKVKATSAAVVSDAQGRHDPARIEVVMWE